MKHVIFALLFLIRIIGFSQDLVISNYNVPSSFARYEEIPISVTVRNNGIIPIKNGFNVGLFLSVDDNLQPYSVDVGVDGGGGYVAPTVAPGQSKAATYYGSSFDAPPGTYNLFIVVDPFEYVTETNEGNNVIMIPNVVVTDPDVDFMFSSFELPARSYTQNAMISPEYAFENIGSVNVYCRTYVELVLSTDAVYSDDDLEIGDKLYDLEGSDERQSEYLDYVLPTVAPGNYYVLGIVDSNDRNFHLEETNEENNVVVVPVTITEGTIDLEISAVTSVEYTGSSLYTSFTIINHGTDGVGRYDILVELTDQSGDPIPVHIENWEEELEYAYRNFVQGGSDREVRVNTYLWEDLDPGIYYVRFTLNPDCQILETNCSNNTFLAEAFPIIVGSPIVSQLKLHSLSLPDKINDADQEIVLDLNLSNIGTTTDFDQFYTVTITDDQDTEVYSEQVKLAIDLAPQETATRSIVLTLSYPLAVGSYQVSLACGPDCHTALLPSTATFTVVPAEYLLTGTVQGEDGVPINKGQLFLYQDNGTGEVRFIKKIVPYQGPTFSFNIDGHNYHTLYFVPDPVLYPGYAPTLYGKTVTIQPSSFFRATADMNVAVNVIKIQSLATGTGIIQGYVTSGNASDETPEPLASVENVPVVLLSSTGKVVGVAYTDATGFYEFKGLPRDSYQVVLRLELDNAQMLPYTIDITEQNVRLDLTTLPGRIDPVSSQLFLPQDISFSHLGARPYGSARISLDAESDQALPLEYTSSDTEVATVENYEIIIHNAGTAVITASQDGNTFYLPATASQTLVVTPAAQSISFDALTVQMVDAGPLNLSATASSGLTVSFESSDNAIVSIEGQTAMVHQTGMVNITARQPGNRNYLAAAEVTRKLIIHTITGIEHVDLANYAHPNPTSDVVFLEIQHLSQVDVFDALGKERRDVGRVNNTLDFSRVEAGVYLIRVLVDNRPLITRIVKK